VAFRLSAEAHKELEEYRATLISSTGKHLITAEKAMALHWDKINELVGKGMVEEGDMSLVPMECTGCAKIVVVAADVREYKCKCSPNKTRWVHQSRKIERDSPLGITGIEEYMRAYSGRETITFTR
jgi:hypothetical protein